MKRDPRPIRPGTRPPLRVLPTTLWEYPSQHYDAWVSDSGEVVRSRHAGATQGSKEYVGATPSWVIWQCLTRYTREGDTVVDPMCGSGTTLDVCADLSRKGVGFDLAPSRPDIRQADARTLPLSSSSADFIFIDPPYSTHVDYSDDPRCIGRLDASTGDPRENEYFRAMSQVFGELHRVLRDRRYLALYVSDSFKKKSGQPGGLFVPIGFELFSLLRERFKPIDIVCVVRQNQKLQRGNWRKAAEEGNYFLRGFNYLLLFKKESSSLRAGRTTTQLSAPSRPKVSNQRNVR